MNDKKLITCISLPRSGTNFIFNTILRKINNFNVNLELFSNSETIRKKTINKKYYYPDLEKKDSLDIIEYLINKEEKYLIHKIFRAMFCNDYFDIDLLNIIIKSNFIFFIKRNFLDIYISEKKAKITNKYVGLDTSNIKIYFDINDFNNHLEYYKIWFQIAKQKCYEVNKTFIILDYDEIIKLENEIEMINFVYDKFLSLTNDNLSLNMNYKHNYKMTKQDNAKSYEDKIENYEEVKDFISNKDDFINDIV
jgi:hypothetical protein